MSSCSTRRCSSNSSERASRTDAAALDRRHETHVDQAHLRATVVSLDLEHDVAAIPLALVVDERAIPIDDAPDDLLAGNELRNPLRGAVEILISRSDRGCSAHAARRGSSRCEFLVGELRQPRRFIAHRARPLILAGNGSASRHVRASRAADSRIRRTRPTPKQIITRSFAP
jgi:hypothetical protein